MESTMGGGTNSIECDSETEFQATQRFHNMEATAKSTVDLNNKLSNFNSATSAVQMNGLGIQKRNDHGGANALEKKGGPSGVTSAFASNMRQQIESLLN